LGLAKSCSSSVTPPWNPNEAFGLNSPLAIFFIVFRMAGSSLLVPMLEELFFRSFVYRFLASKDWMEVPLGRFLWMPFLVTSLAFGLEHNDWLAGILCGFTYQALVIWKNRLGDAITAHAITNLLLGLWVVWRGAWHFW
jgi:CAAX prenyl protease-like protein